MNHREPVLFLLMEFPPVNTTGNFRGAKFVKYLSQLNDIDPIVVTFFSEQGSRIFNAKIDEELINEIPKHIYIYRINCSEKSVFFGNKIDDFLSIYFSIKDSLAKRWKNNLFQEITQIIDKHKPKAIFTSLPPFSSGMLSVEISKKFNLPLIIDMRDLWAFFGNPLATWIHYYITIKEENKIFSHSKAIIVVTQHMQKILTKTHRNIPADKIHVIPNGYDKPIEYSESFSFNSTKDKIVIGYVGSFYYEPKIRDNVFKSRWKKRWHKKLEYVPIKLDWKYRSPFYFFKALQYLFLKYPELKKKIFIEFVGKKPHWLDDMLFEFNLTSNFFSHGFVTQKEALLIQNKFDILLATSEKVIDSEHFYMPSKIFDYVGQNKPILSFVTEGVQKDFLLKSGLGIVCNPDNSEEAASIIYDLIVYGKSIYPNIEYIKQFHRLTLTEKLNKLLYSIIEGE